MSTALARNTDPDTSHEAARTVRRRLCEQVRAGVVRLLEKYGPMTDEDIAEWWTDPGFADVFPVVSSSGLRTRRAELVTEGRVVETGERRRLTSGRRAIVWGIAAQGEAEAAA